MEPIHKWSDAGLARVAAGINASLAAESNMRVGAIVMHPDGYKVKVIDGAFLRNGRVSNFWRWQRVNDDGSLNDTVECGYGW
jgi:hypothetical protein